MERFARRHAASSEGQLASLLLDEIEDKEAAVEERLGEWEERRPTKIGDREATQLGDAVAKVVFVAAGVRLLRWQTTGDNCPYCEEMNGRVVGVDQSFIPKGGDLSPEGEQTYRPSGNIGHAPLHTGCDCTVVPG